MSLVLQWHVLYLENLFLFFSSLTSNFSPLLFFTSPFSPRNHLRCPFYSDGGLCTHTVICHFNWACSVGNGEFTAFCSGRQSNPPKSQTLPSLPPSDSGRGKPLGEVWALVQFCSPVTLGQAPPFYMVSKYLFWEASQWNKQDPGWNQCLGLASFYATVILLLCLAGKSPWHEAARWIVSLAREGGGELCCGGHPLFGRSSLNWRWDRSRIWYLETGTLRP